MTEHHDNVTEQGEPRETVVYNAPPWLGDVLDYVEELQKEADSGDIEAHNALVAERDELAKRLRDVREQLSRARSTARDLERQVASRDSFIVAQRGHLDYLEENDKHRMAKLSYSLARNSWLVGALADLGEQAIITKYYNHFEPKELSKAEEIMRTTDQARSKLSTGLNGPRDAD